MDNHLKSLIEPQGSIVHGFHCEHLNIFDFLLFYLFYDGWNEIWLRICVKIFENKKKEKEKKEKASQNKPTKYTGKKHENNIGGHLSCIF